MAIIRKKPKESWSNYNERLQVIYDYKKELNTDYKGALGSHRSSIIQFDDTERYKKFLEDNNIPYVEGEIEKESGKVVHWIFPQCYFKTLSKTDVNKLFKVN